MMFTTAYGALIDMGGLQGRGARMAFDPVGGPDARNLLRALSDEGVFFQYGALDARDIPVPVMDILGKHLTLRGYELFEITRDHKKLQGAKEFITRGLSIGALRPLIDRTFKFEEIADAHRYMEGRKPGRQNHCGCVRTRGRSALMRTFTGLISPTAPWRALRASVLRFSRSVSA